MSKPKGKVQEKCKSTDRKKQQSHRNSLDLSEHGELPAGTPFRVVVTPRAPPDSTWSVRVALLGGVLAERAVRAPADQLRAAFHLTAGDRDQMRRVADEPLLIIARETSDSKAVPAMIGKGMTPTKGGKMASDEKVYADIMKSSVASIDLLPILLGEGEVWTSVTTTPTCEGSAALQLEVLVQAEHGRAWRGCGCRNVLQLSVEAAYHLPLAKPDQLYTCSFFLLGSDGNHTEFKYDGGSRFVGDEKSRWRRWASLSGAGAAAARSSYRRPAHDDCLYNIEGLDISACLYNNYEHDCFPVEWESCRRLLLWADDEAFLEQLLEAEVGLPISLLSPKGQLMAFVNVSQILYPEELEARVVTPVYRFDPVQWAAAMKSPFERASVVAVAKPEHSAPDLTAECDESNTATFLIFHMELFNPLNKENDIITLYDMIDPLLTIKMQEKPSGTTELSPEKSFQYAVYEATQHFQQLYLDYKLNTKESSTIMDRQASLSSFFVRAVQRRACEGALRMEKEARQLVDSAEWNIDALTPLEYEGDQVAFSSDINTGRVWRVERRLWRAVNSATRAGPPPLPPTPQPRVAIAAALAARDTRCVLRYTAQNSACDPHDRSAVLNRAAALCDAARRDEAFVILQEALLSRPDDHMIMLACAAFEIEEDKRELLLRATVQLRQGWCVSLAALQVHYTHTRQQRAAQVLGQRLKKSMQLAYVEDDHMGMEQEIWTDKELPRNRIYLICAALFLRIRAFQMAEACLRRDETESESAAASGARAYLRAAAALLGGVDPTAHYAAALRHSGPAYHVLWLHGEILLRHGADEEAVTSLALALDGVGKGVHATLHARLAGLLVARGAPQQASRLLHQLLPEWSEAPHIWMLLGRATEQLGDLAMAEQCYATSVALDRWLSEAWALLARLALLRSRPERARQCLHWMQRTNNHVPPDLLAEIDVLQSELTPLRIEEHLEEFSKDYCQCSDI